MRHLLFDLVQTKIELKLLSKFRQGDLARPPHIGMMISGMAHRVPITVRLEAFEGPLDLLLYLIQTHEMDVSKISITKITDQYLAYVRLMQDLNFDIASEFLVMAATLLHWKSKAILPQEKDDIQAAAANAEGELTAEDLVRQLMERKRFLEVAGQFGQFTRLGEDVFTRPSMRKKATKIWRDMDMTSIALTFQDMLVRQRKRTTVLKKETVSLSTKILEWKDTLEVGKMTPMTALMTERPLRPEQVVTFLASLELSKLKKMRLFQQEVYETIYVELLESLKDFDTRLAAGFDSVAEAAGIGEHVSSEPREQQPGIESGDANITAAGIPGPQLDAYQLPRELPSLGDQPSASS